MIKEKPIANAAAVTRFLRFTSNVLTICCYIYTPYVLVERLVYRNFPNTIRAPGSALSRPFAS